jgi:hypothetical protein
MKFIAQTENQSGTRGFVLCPIQLTSPDLRLMARYAKSDGCCSDMSVRNEKKCNESPKVSLHTQRETYTESERCKRDGE